MQSPAKTAREKLVEYDALRRRVWVLGQRCHHGATGSVVAGLAFMALGTVALGLPASWSPAILALGFGGVHIALGVIILRDHGG